MPEQNQPRGVSATRNDALRQYAAEGLRPQSLLFTLLGRHVLDRDVAVASSTFIDALERLAEVLREGGARMFEAPVRDLPEDLWTLLIFSIPEEQRADRHSLRAALAWSGFGLLRNGLWIAPGAVDVSSIVERLGLQERIDLFTASPAKPTDMQRVVTEAWDLDLIADEYRELVRRWAAGPPPGVDDILAGHILMITEWQQILVDDPELPVQYLPGDWPALKAYAIFRHRQSAFADEATQAFEEILDASPLEDLPDLDE